MRPESEVPDPQLPVPSANARHNGSTRTRKVQDESSGPPPARKRTRTSASGDEKRDDAGKRARGRPRLSTEDQTAADVSFPLPTSFRNTKAFGTDPPRRGGNRTVASSNCSADLYISGVVHKSGSLNGPTGTGKMLPYLHLNRRSRTLKTRT